jgi:hypothetical protein
LWRKSAAPRLQRLHGDLEAITSREDHHRDVDGRHAPVYRVDAFAVGQAEVDDQHVGRLVLHRLQPVRQTLGPAEVDVGLDLAHVLLEETRVARIVFDEHDAEDLMFVEGGSHVRMGDVGHDEGVGASGSHRAVSSRRAMGAQRDQVLGACSHERGRQGGQSVHGPRYETSRRIHTPTTRCTNGKAATPLRARWVPCGLARWIAGPIARYSVALRD